MSKVTCGIGVSIDGFVAGQHQSFKNPMGKIPENLLHKWMCSEEEGNKQKAAMLDYLVDADAFIMGSNMFMPEEKRDDPTWKGWWGDNPPYHAPVFVLCTKARESIEMEGGTTFHFVTDGIESAFRQAKEAARNGKISIAGGANTINQYLAAGLIDEIWLHIAPVTIGSGARLFAGVPNLKLEPVETSSTSHVTHIRYKVMK
jgi:dihydrofolate reductase